MNAPLWRLEEFPSEYRAWRQAFSPSEAVQRRVLAWAIAVEDEGPSDNLIRLDDEQEGYQGLEPIPGTQVSVLCLVYERAGRIIVTDIRG